MECHLVEQRRDRFISVHLVVRVIILVREVKLTDVVPSLTGQDTLYFTLCMVRLVIYMYAGDVTVKGGMVIAGGGSPREGHFFI